MSASNMVTTLIYHAVTAESLKVSNSKMILQLTLLIEKVFQKSVT